MPRFLVLLILYPLLLVAKPCLVTLGIDRLFEDPDYRQLLAGKNVAIVTNHTAITSDLESTIDRVMRESSNYNVVALFAPEHGLQGQGYASEAIESSEHKYKIPIHSLHGKTRRPTAKMLDKIDLILVDIQDIGSRSYSYCTTLFYVMEEAAKKKISVVVADRPNPMGGLIVDGPLLEEKFRSFLGYINVPYCHGMTLGELAHYFNEEYHVGCSLTVVPMRGWTRDMTFKDTGLTWVPTSPQIPEMDTPFFYSTTGILGEMKLVNIGVGYTLPFKVIGAPWINAEQLAERLNNQHFPGVHFQPYYFRPFFGLYKQKNCQGVRIVITDESIYQPLSTQYLLLGMLKTLYPKQFEEALNQAKGKFDEICKINGCKEVLRQLQEEKYVVYSLKKICDEARREFAPTRKKYLIAEYAAVD